MNMLKAQAFNEIAVSLAEENEAHSDDEFDQEDNQTREQVYHITLKEGRSKKVKDFFRMIDVQRQHANRRKQKHQRFLAMTVCFFFHSLTLFLVLE